MIGNASEELRQRAVLDCNILDSPSEPAYEGIVQLAALLCRTPFAVVTFLDSERIWFKAKWGELPNEVPRSGGLCSLTVELERTLVMPDTHAHPQGRRAAAVVGPPHVRFYVGVPVREPGGVVVGTLCVMDIEPRAGDAAALHGLELLARQVESLLVLRRADREALSEATRRREQVELMAAGVAHEINNPLTCVVVGLDRLEAALREVPADGAAARQAREHMHVVREGAARVEATISQLREVSELSRRTKLRPVDVASLVRRSRLFLDGALDQRIEVVEQIESAHAMADPDRLGQVLLNLILNASHALAELPDGHEPRRLTLRTTALGDEVLITVDDTGPGIPEDHREAVFQPFFTTKGGVQGTGLGLTMSRAAVEAMGGQLQLESRSGEGARFTINLPRVQAEGDAQGPPDRSAALRVLFIDDDAMVRDTVVMCLGERHESLAVASANEADAVLARDRGFDLILCDVRMPGRNGTEFLADLRESDPELAARVALTSGHASELQGLGVPVLPKPFSSDTLNGFVEQHAVRVEA